MTIRNLRRKREYSMHEKNSRNCFYAYRIKNGDDALTLLYIKYTFYILMIKKIKNH